MEGKDNFLLKNQIAESCRLALPEGLKDLMSDISREVLRAQPESILPFITQYLAALLVTRENIHAASHICRDLCEHICAANLEDELRYKGFDEELISKVKAIVNSYLLKAGAGVPIKEGNIMTKILKETPLNVDRIEDIQDAVRSAVLKHLARNTTTYELTPESSLDSVNRAVQHTLDLYHKGHPTQDDYDRAATKIGAAYRAYGVRRAKKCVKEEDTRRFIDFADSKTVEVFSDEDSLSGSDDLIHDKQLDEVVSYQGKQFEYTDIRSEAVCGVATNVSEQSNDDDCGLFFNSSKAKLVTTVSSTSLAGSFLNLPAHKPYTVFDDIKEVADEEVSPHTTIDYTDEAETKNDLTGKFKTINNLTDEFDIEYNPDLPRQSVEEKCIDYGPGDYESDDVDSSGDELHGYDKMVHESVIDMDEVPENFDNRSYDA